MRNRRAANKKKYAVKSRSSIHTYINLLYNVIPELTFSRCKRSEYLFYLRKILTLINKNYFANIRVIGKSKLCRIKT